MGVRIHRKNNSKTLPTFMGHSVGHRESNTLVVDTVGFNEGTWIDKEGHPHTSQLHVIEKLTRTSVNNLHIEATFDDPGPTHGPGPLRSILPGVRIGRSRNTFARRTTGTRITTYSRSPGSTDFTTGPILEGTGLNFYPPSPEITCELDGLIQAQFCEM